MLYTVTIVRKELTKAALTVVVRHESTERKSRVCARPT